MDPNSGLTQVLSDGATSYTYGNGRISQHAGATAEYYLVDALGSVRQMASSTGTLTYNQAYDPYGVVTLTEGAGHSAYGFTGEQQDVSGLVYLRARHYAPGVGMFMTKDTWPGYSKIPISYNKWAYANKNPVSYSDPTGKYPIYENNCGLSLWSGINFADKNVNLPRNDWRNTYTAAGIAVQCWAKILDNPFDDYAGLGPAQITNKQKTKPYGKKVLDDNGDTRGYGLLCYIVDKALSSGNVVSLCVCDDEDTIREKVAKGEYVNYRLEDPLDQTKISGATILMKRRIMQVINKCRAGCTETDIFIAAAMAQNSSLNPQEMFEISNPKPKNPKDLLRIDVDDRGISIDWKKYFDEVRKKNLDTYTQVGRFQRAVYGLNDLNWAIPSGLVEKTIMSFSKP